MKQIALGLFLLVCCALAQPQYSVRVTRLNNGVPLFDYKKGQSVFSYNYNAAAFPIQNVRYEQYKRKRRTFQGNVSINLANKRFPLSSHSVLHPTIADC